MTVSSTSPVSGTFQLGGFSGSGGTFTVTGDGGGSVQFVGNGTLSGDVGINNDLPVTLSGAIDQAGGARGLTKSGPAGLTITGSTSNTFTGTLNVQAGSVQLNKSAGAIAAGGNLLVSNGALITYLAPNQVADTATVSLTGSGTTLDLGVHSDTIASLTVGAGAVLTSNGDATLRATGSISVAGRATFAPNGVASSLDVSGTLVLSSTGHLLTTQALAVGEGALLDLGGNALAIDYGGASPATTIRNLIIAGRAAGAWNGKGICSSLAGSDTSGSLAVNRRSSACTG